MKNIIAIDLGATSGRVVLSQWDGQRLYLKPLHRFPTPLVKEGDKYFWDICKLFEDIVCGLSKASGQKIDSIGIDTWGVDFCPVDAEGKVGNPRAYRDPYTDGVPEAFFKEMPLEELYRRTGIQIMNFNSVFQFYAQNRAGELCGAEKFLFIPDALSYMLTGNMVCEYTILSTSAMMDPRTSEFDPEVLRVCGLKRGMFPRIVMPGEVVGTLAPSIAKVTGLGAVPVIAVAGHDTASAVYAVPARNERFAYLSSGTWSLMGIETPEAVINEQMRSLNFTNEGGARGNTRLLKNITGMWALEQCLEQWRKEGRDYSYGELAAMAVEHGPSQVLLDFDEQVFAAPQNMPQTICRRAGCALDVADIVRLIYDSLAAKYAMVLERLRSVAPFEIDTLHIIGGGSKNDLLNQLTADACGIRVVAGPAEGTALGNAMIQLGLGRSDIANSIETKIFIPNE